MRKSAEILKPLVLACVHLQKFIVLQENSDTETSLVPSSSSLFLLLVLSLHNFEDTLRLGSNFFSHLYNRVNVILVPSTSFLLIRKTFSGNVFVVNTHHLCLDYQRHIWESPSEIRWKWDLIFDGTNKIKKNVPELWYWWETCMEVKNKRNETAKGKCRRLSERTMTGKTPISLIEGSPTVRRDATRRAPKWRIGANRGPNETLCLLWEGGRFRGWTPCQA